MLWGDWMVGRGGEVGEEWIARREGGICKPGSYNFHYSSENAILVWIWRQIQI